MRGLLLFVFCWTIAKAYPQSYNFRLFNQSTGLSSSNIKKIVQDDYGFIWMGTQDGLTRFDGKNSLVLQRPFLNGTDVSNLYYDPLSKLLWVSYSRGGINALNTTTLSLAFSFKDSPAYKKLQNVVIRCLMVDKQSKLWIGTEKGLYVMSSAIADDMKELLYCDTSLHAAPPVTGVATDIRGNVIAVCSRGVIVFDKGNLNKFTCYPFNIGDVPVYSASYNRHMDAFTISTERGLYLFDAGKAILCSLPIVYGGKNMQRTYCAEFDKEGVL